MIAEPKEAKSVILLNFKTAKKLLGSPKDSLSVVVMVTI